MAVQIQKEVRGHHKEAEWLQRRARLHLRNLSAFRVRAAAALPRAELSILLTSDKKIHILNRKWRGKDKPTDVLSFPQQDQESLIAIARRGSAGSPWELGDLVISLERAKAQAKEKNFTMKEELDWLLAHGILHLLGYDHEISRREEKRMRRLELRILERLGWSRDRIKKLVESI